MDAASLLSSSSLPAEDFKSIKGGDLEILEEIIEDRSNLHLARHMKRIDMESVLDMSSHAIKSDIVKIITQYLRQEGYHQSCVTLQDESEVKVAKLQVRNTNTKKIRKAIFEGDWDNVRKLATKPLLKHNLKAFLYAAYKQEYLELIDRQEFQLAFSFLQKKLKPLESNSASFKKEFSDLCYLLTCRSVQDVPAFAEWEGIASSRAELAATFQAMVELPGSFDPSTNSSSLIEEEIPPNRLLTLLKQALAYQIEFSRYHPRITPHVSSLLEDYQCFTLPNNVYTTYKGHSDGVKCVTFVGESGNFIASGGSDRVINIYKTETQTDAINVSGNVIENPIHRLSGHASRIWDISTSRSGNILASASGDEKVKLWDLSLSPHLSTPTCTSTFSHHVGDVYTVKIHPRETHIVSGGYDKTIKLVDIRTGVCVKEFLGHSAPVSQVIFNPHGNLIISGSKDSTVKFWDITSGVCVKTYSTHLGEVTSLAMSSSGEKLLTVSKDNSNRLWDVRTAKPVQRFKGHQNTSKNFIRAIFGPSESVVLGGSEDGNVYIWDIKTGNVLQKLKGHKGVVYHIVWSNTQSLAASCSHDGTVKTWWQDQNSLLTASGTGSI